MVLVRDEELVVVRIAHDGCAGARACRAHRVEAETGDRAEEAAQHDDLLRNLHGLGRQAGNPAEFGDEQPQLSAVYLEIDRSIYLFIYRPTLYRVTAAGRFIPRAECLSAWRRM